MKQFFSFSKHNTNFHRELIAALSTFATMAYVLVINASILNDAGMDFGAVMVATIIVTVISCLLMGLIARYPIALAPGMGVSAYIAYTIVQAQGKSWEECLAATCLVALLLLLLTALKIRQKLLTEIPLALKHAIPAGIGVFLIFVGLKHSGIIIQKHEGLIQYGNLFTTDALLTFLVLGAILILERFRVQSAYIIMILVSWGLSIFFGYIPYKGAFALPPSLEPTFLKLDFSNFWSWDFFTILFSIFLVTLLDSTATLTTLVKQANLLNEKGHVSRIRKALIPDAIGTFIGSLIGSAAIAVHMESAAGIKAGGKTGFVPFFVALCFLGCLFFYPIVATIPSFAPSAVLIALGLLMIYELKLINWKEWSDFVPALVILLIMPLTLSIYNGFSFGFIIYAFCKIVRGRKNEIHPLIGIVALLFLAHRLFELFTRFQ
jgi:AGZA family xanthine/uracil permease-like MFS transporter